VIIQFSIVAKRRLPAIFPDAIMGRINRRWYQREDAMQEALWRGALHDRYHAGLVISSSGNEKRKL